MVKTGPALIEVERDGGTSRVTERDTKGGKPGDGVKRAVELMVPQWDGERQSIRVGRRVACVELHAR